LIACRLIVPLALFAALAAGCDVFGGDNDSATATPTVVEGTPAPTQTPTPPPPDPDLAERLRYEGEYEAAIEVYTSIVQQADGEAKQDARLAAADLFVRTERYEEARDTLGAYLLTEGAPSDGSAARYMFASTLDDLGDPAGALASYEVYINAGGAASDFAKIERAKMLARLARAVDAEQAAAEVLALDIFESFKSSFMLSMGSAYEQARLDAEALAWYDRARNTPGADIASAVARSGGVRKRLGDPAWTADFLQYVTNFPGGGAAMELLGELDAAAVPVNDYVRGVVAYRAFENEAARAALSREAAGGEYAAEATYYLGALEERTGAFDAAIAQYARVVELNPQSTLADDALWWRGRLLELSGRGAEATQVYRQLFDGYPASEWRSDAGFRRGLVPFRQEDYVGAAQGWADVAAGIDDDEERLRIRYWHARALKEDGDDETAEELLEELRAEAPADFYGLRAEVLLGDNDKKVESPDLDEDEIDWDEVDAWVREAAGLATATPAASAPPIDERSWEEAAELVTVGLRAQGDALFRGIITLHQDEPLGLLAVTRRLHEEGRTSLAARAAATLIASFEEDGGEPPEALLRVSYPLAFGDLVEGASDEEDVPPLLLLALVRQESFYDPDAGSTAGALGLTQVIPSTGDSIASVLGLQPFDPKRLFRPKLSLRFGANYLSSQLEQFDENEYHALAAYNGGPGTAANALESSGDDLDLFVEDLEFDETRLYVKLVLENYARYRQLYEGVDRPSLPR
jgi:soluble lytic murein transglycosylase